MFYVYCIGQVNEDHTVKTVICKIGSSKHPESRLHQLQTANPHKLVLLYVVETPKYKEFEKYAHKFLKIYNLNGEWFEISKEKLDFLFMMFKINTEESFQLIQDYCSIYTEKELSNSKIGNLNSKIGNLNSKIQKFKNENNKFKNENNKFKKLYENTMKKAENFENKMNIYQNKKRKLKSENQILKQELENIEQISKKLKQELDEFQTNKTEEITEGPVCHRCLKEFKTYMLLAKHWKKSIPCDFSCHDCGRRLGSKRSYQKHKKAQCQAVKKFLN